MDLTNFKKKLQNIYKTFPEFNEEIHKVSNEYLTFLYLHLNNDIKFIITNKSEINKHTLLIKKISCDKQYCDVLMMIYHKFLTDEEIKLLSNKTNFNVIFYQEKYDEIGTDNYFKAINRRDFLIPCFLHERTIYFLNKMNYNENSSYNDRFKDFHVLLGALRKNIKTIEKLGVIICSSFTLNTYNIRKSKDIDLIILHPYHYSNNIRNKLKFNIVRKYKFIDPHVVGVLEWKGIDKANMYNLNKMEDINIKNFYHIIFNPNYHYYFFGLKVIDISIDLRYRAIRAYPKNIADLILVKSKIDVEIPRIKPIPEKITIEKNTYSKTEFIEVIVRYLKKFRYNTDYHSVLEHLKEITLR